MARKKSLGMDSQLKSSFAVKSVPKIYRLSAFSGRMYYSRFKYIP